jgi:hypothetical protein
MGRNCLKQALGRITLAAVLCAALPAAWAQSKNLAPGFASREASSRLVLMPADVELFSLSAGGVQEPRADWTQAAQGHIVSALAERRARLGTAVVALSERELDEFGEISALHGALADNIFLHHMIGGAFQLPTKNGALDWTMGEAVADLRQRTGADYALFVWVRDSYASAERKAAMVALALLGVGIAGGTQVGYASLIDLRDGRVVWFNHLLRGTGDLREAKAADETLDALLKNFPPTR